MVDIADMAAKLADVFPDEAAALSAALQAAVVCNRHNSDVVLGGLSAYYIFGGRNDAENTLGMYSSLRMDGAYTDYLHTFADALRGSGGGRAGESEAGARSIWRPVPGEPGRYYLCGDLGAGGALPTIGGAPVCLDKTDSSRRGVEYAIPVRHNGQDADIIVLFCEKYPAGRIMGVRRETGYMIQKGLDEIEPGDVIEFYYVAASIGDGGEVEDCGWFCGNGITVESGIELEWKSVGEVGEIVDG